MPNLTNPKRPDAIRAALDTILAAASLLQNHETDGDTDAPLYAIEDLRRACAVLDSVILDDVTAYERETAACDHEWL